MGSSLTILDASDILKNYELIISFIMIPLHVEYYIFCYMA